jgi:hypothetical protein
MENLVTHDALKAVEKEYELQKMRFKESRTSNLWLSFLYQTDFHKRYASLGEERNFLSKQGKQTTLCHSS